MPKPHKFGTELQVSNDYQDNYKISLAYQSKASRWPALEIQAAAITRAITYSKKLSLTLINIACAETTWWCNYIK